MDTVATVMVVDVNLSNNTADLEGAGMGASDIGSLTVSGTTFSGNVAAQSAALAVATSTATVTGSHFDGNVASSGSGGVMIAGDAAVTITDCDMVGNSADAGQGGAVLVTGSSLSATNLRLEDNSAGDGGAFACSGAGASFTGETIAMTANVASSSGGGAAALAGCSLAFTGSALSNNMAGTSGGGLAVGAASSLTLTASSVSNNTAGGDLADGHGGGGLFLAPTASATFDTVQMLFNSAAAGCGGGVLVTNGVLSLGTVTVGDGLAMDGGALCVLDTEVDGDGLDPTVLDLAEFSLVDNTATARGGALFLARGASSAASVPAPISDGLIDGNTAGVAGGGFYFSESTFVVAGTAFTSNSAPSGGAIAVFDAAVLDVSAVSFSNNSADQVHAAVVLLSGGVCCCCCCCYIVCVVPRCNPPPHPIPSHSMSLHAQGGAVFVWNATMTALSLTASGNAATRGSGGFAYAANAVITTAGITGDSNSASQCGGWAFFTAEVRLS